MKGFFDWFKSSSKMKRWMFLIILGNVLLCYGISQFLVYDEMNFRDVAKLFMSFMAGFIFIVLGLVFLNKRTLEVFVEASDDRMENKKNVNVKSLIFNKTIYDQGPNVVVIGGGAGLNTVLSGMKNYTNNITAIVTVSEYGKMPSNSRKELQTLPLGDIKDSIISLSQKNEEVSKLFNYEFSTGKLKGFTFSDIYFSAMYNINQDFSQSIIKSSEVINMVGKVIPATLDEMKICAELENGYVVEEKDRIPEVVYEKMTKINRIFVSPSNCRPAPGVIEAIREADSIIIGPGSLYTNVLPNLLIPGISRAIKESKAIKIYVNNIMTEPGQTDEYSVSDHINAIIDHCGDGLINYCVYDTGEIIPEYIKMYNKEGSDLVEQNLDNVKTKGIKFLKRNISVISDGRIRHDSRQVAEAVIQLICDDLKYQDKQNDPEYLMMNTKLREDKRINKMNKASKKANMKDEKNLTSKKGRKSKFSSKYSERIQSIKESSEKEKNLLKAKSKQKSKTKKANEKNNVRDEMLKKLKESKLKK